MRNRWVYKGGQAVAQFSDGNLVWALPEYYHQDPKEVHHVMPDIQPYRSMIDGSMITSRSQHREHLKANGCFEVGNETKHILKDRPVEMDRASTERRKRMIAEQVDAKFRR